MVFGGWKIDTVVLRKEFVDFQEFLSPHLVGGTGVLNVIREKLFKYEEKTEMREIPKNQDLTGDLQCIFIFYQKPKMIPGSIRTFW